MIIVGSLEPEIKFITAFHYYISNYKIGGYNMVEIKTNNQNKLFNPLTKQIYIIDSFEIKLFDGVDFSHTIHPKFRINNINFDIFYLNKHIITDLNEINNIRLHLL